MSIILFDPNKSEKAENKLLSNIDTSEPFVAQMWELLDILRLTKYSNKTEINDAIFSILIECLLPAHISLINIKNHISNPALPEIDKQKDYFDLHNHLWAAYKDRMLQVFENSKFNIGFLFQKDKFFEQGLEKLKEDFPTVTDDFLDWLTENRNTWQKDMAMIRNDYIQHKKIESKVVEKFFTPENSEIIFDNIWKSIANIILLFLSLELPSDIFTLVKPYCLVPLSI